MSTSELRQRDKYIEDAFGIKKKSTRLIALEKQLELAIKYDTSTLDSPLYGIEVIFAVGDGAEVHTPDYSNNTVTWKEFVNQASVANFSNSDEYAGLFGGLDRPRYIYTSPSNVQNYEKYRLYKPFLNHNKWVRRFYAKLPEEVLIFDSADKDGFPVKVQHVICRITKEDLLPYTQTEINSGSGIINELCVYMGQKVKTAKNSGDDSTAYLLLNHPKIDTVNVEPYFRVVFNDIRVDDIPDNGLDFIFDIELHIAELQDDEDSGGDTPPEQPWPTGKIVVKFADGFIILNETSVPEITIPSPPSPPYNHIDGDITVSDLIGNIAIDESSVPQIVIPTPPYTHVTGNITISDVIGNTAINEINVPDISVPIPPVPPYAHITGDVTISDFMGNIAINELDVPNIIIPDPPVPPYNHIAGNITVSDIVGNIAINEIDSSGIIVPIPPYNHVTGDITISDLTGSLAINEINVPSISIPVPPIPPYDHITGNITVEDDTGNIAIAETDVPGIILPIPPYIHATGNMTITDSTGNVAIDETVVSEINIPIPPIPRVTITDDSGSIDIINPL
jgi:hypothetical protein